MVQSYTAPTRVYKYPFELVMTAYQRRFPTCHLIPVFVGSDMINEKTSEDGAIHVIERRCTINVEAPYLLRKIVGVDHIMFIQKNTLDRRKRVLKIEAWNESFSNHINIHELCYYKANKDNCTVFEQQASLEVKSFWGFEGVVEKLAVKHYSQNVNKGEEIIEYHIKELAEEGITYLPPFEPLSLTNIEEDEAVDADVNVDQNVSTQPQLTSSGKHSKPNLAKKLKNGLFSTKSFDHSNEKDKPSEHEKHAHVQNVDLLRSKSLDEDSPPDDVKQNLGSIVVADDPNRKSTKNSRHFLFFS